MKKYVLILSLLLSTPLIMFSFKIDETPFKKEKLKINITTMGNVKKSDVDLVSDEITKFYDANVILLPKTDLIINSKVSGINKYNATKILNTIQEKYPNTQHKVLLLTNYNICTDRTLNGVTHKNWGIFGMAKLGKKPCVVSTHNMGKNYKDRLIKVSIHETGHTLGVPHCKNTKCVMTDAKGKGSTVDNATIWMCNECKNKIRY
jgi:archaemetzincin